MILFSSVKRSSWTEGAAIDVGVEVTTVSCVPGGVFSALQLVVAAERLSSWESKARVDMAMRVSRLLPSKHLEQALQRVCTVSLRV